MIQTSSRDIRGSRLEKRLAHACDLRAFEQVQHHLAGKSPRTIFIANADVQYVRLARAHRHDAVAAHIARHIDDAADVAHPQTVAENSLAPGKLIGRPFDRRDHRDIELMHGPNVDPRKRLFELDARHASTPRARISDLPRLCASRWAYAIDTLDDKSPPAAPSTGRIDAPADARHPTFYRCEADSVRRCARRPT